MLSASVFIAPLQQYSKFENDPLSIIYVSHNLNLIRKESSHKNYNNPYANTTLSSEFNVTEQIYLINKANKIRSYYSWIKGHQDDDEEEEDIPLLAQLNIEADRIAGEFQHTNGHYQHIAPMLTSCPATLSIRNISITSKYRHHLLYPQE